MLLGDLVFSICVLLTALFAGLFVSGRSREVIDHSDDAPLGELLTITAGVGAAAIGMFHALFQMRHFAHPVKQKLVSRIICLPIIYAIDSLYAFEDVADAGIIAIVRDTYEAICLDAFFKLLEVYADEHFCYDYMVTDDSSSGGNKKQKMTKPLCTREQVTSWRLQVLQYTILSPLCTIVILAANHFGFFHESTWAIADAHLWTTLIKAISCTLSLNALVAFYSTVKQHPKIHHGPENPTPQFLSIKGAIFLCCWQGMILSFLAARGILPVKSLTSFLLRDSSIHTKNEEELLEATLGATESSLICLEMFLAAVAHQFVFSYKLYGKKSSNVPVTSGSVSKSKTPVIVETKDGDVFLVKTSVVTSFFKVVAFDDLVDDVKQHAAAAVGGEKQQASKKQQQQQTSKTKQNDKNQQQKQPKQQQKKSKQGKPVAAAAAASSSGGKKKKK